MANDSYGAVLGSVRTRRVPRYPGYTVTDQGAVLNKHGEQLKPFVRQSGHLVVMVSYGPPGARRQKSRLIHQLVLEAFIGPRPAGKESLHRNGNPADNRLKNLRWGTKKENAQDTIRHGRNFHINVTHCPAGHPYDGANTYYRPNGYRVCKRCRADKEYRRRRQCA